MRVFVRLFYLLLISSCCRNRKQTAPIATFTCIDNVMSFDAVRGTNGGALTVAAACCDGSVRGFVHGEEGEGQEGGARVPQWSLQFLEQDKVCVCVCVCVCACVFVLADEVLLLLYVHVRGLHFQFLYWE